MPFAILTKVYERHNEVLFYKESGDKTTSNERDMMNETETCKKHGEVAVWVVCRHVGEGTSDTIIFSENQDALCFDCAHDFKNLTEHDVIGMCEDCLKDFTASLMINTKTFANLKSRVIGIEYLKKKNK